MSAQGRYAIMSDDVPARTVGRFLRAVDANRKLTIELTFSEAAELSKDEPLFEVLEDGKYYVPYTDCDHYCESIERPTEEYIDDVQEKMFNNMNKLINHQLRDVETDFKMATRHGVQVEKNVYKLSWRCYFYGYVITMAEMKRVIVRKGLDKAGVGSLDSSPYGKNQLLGCVGFYKSRKDRRVLKPYDKSPLEEFMVQNITGKEEVLKYNPDEDDDIIESEESNVCEQDENFEGARFAPPWEILVLLVMNLSISKRCERSSYKEWAEVGWAIAGVARVAKKFQDGLELWLQFCRQCMSVYLENPMKARGIYHDSRSQGPQKGWKSLMEWLKEDNIDVYNDICARLGAASAEVITDEHHSNVITDFIHKKFSCRPSHVTSINAKQFDDRRYIFVDTDETYCSIIKGQHLDSNDTSGVYFMIGSERAVEKCRHPDCQKKSGAIVKSSQYDSVTKTVIEKICSRPNETQEVATFSIANEDAGVAVSECRSYESVKQDFEKGWFRLFTPPVFVNVDGDEIHFRKKAELKHVAGLLTFEEISQVRGGNKRVEDVNFLDKWLKDPSQRTYKRIDFLPPPLICDAETTFNTFHQLAAERLPFNPTEFEADFGPIMKLLYDLCDREEKPSEYILDWLAHTVQMPGELSKVGIIMQSKQGRGKNLLFGALFGTRILGESFYFSSADPDDFFGRFAVGRFNRLLSNFNEIEVGHTSKIMGKVKEAITEPVVTFEAKGVMTVRVRNCARQLWFSNETMPIRIPHDDRRWLAVKASNKMPEIGSQEHKTYFATIVNWIKDDRNVRAFYEFLRDRDISNWTPDLDRPITSFYTGLQQLSLNRVEQWLIAQLEDNKLGRGMLSEAIMAGIEKMFPGCGIQFGFAKQILIDIPGIRYGNPTVGKVRARGLYFVHEDIINYYVAKGFMTDPAQDIFVDDSSENE